MRRLLVMVTALTAPACVPGSPVYMGADPVVTFEGEVYVFETREPAGLAEVCAFGADTLCVRANERGHYWLQVRAQILLEGGEMTLRFRVPGMHPSAARLSEVEADSKTTVSCSISNRASFSMEPRACLPPPDD